MPIIIIIIIIIKITIIIIMIHEIFYLIIGTYFIDNNANY